MREFKHYNREKYLADFSKIMEKRSLVENIWMKFLQTELTVLCLREWAERFPL